MATQWMAAPWYKPQRWLLEDGSVVETPELESSGSGRRVRIKGATHSVGRNQIQGLLDTAIDEIAQSRSTKRLMRVFEDDDYIARFQQIVHGNKSNRSVSGSPMLHLLDDNDNTRRREATTVWWRFSVQGFPQLPVYAFATLYTYSNQHTVTAGLVYPITFPEDLEDAQRPVMATWTGGDWAISTKRYFYDPLHVNIREKVQEVKANEGIEWGETTYASAKQAVVAFTKACRAINEIDEVTIPDVRNQTGEDWFTCKSSAITNYTGAFAETLANFLQTGPVLDRLKETVASLTRDLSLLGFVPKNRITETALIQLIDGDPSGLKVHLRVDDLRTLEDGRSVPDEDHHHELLLDLVHGAVILSCDHNQDLDEVAQAWNVAKFQAELTGEADVLLEYARAYKLPRERERLEKIITSRTLEEESKENTSTP